MLHLSIDIDGLPLSQIKALERLAWLAESELDRQIKEATERGDPDNQIRKLKTQANQCCGLWYSCLNELRVERNKL